MSLENLKFKILTKHLEIGKMFVERGVQNLDQVIAHIHQLPYGRNSQRDNFRLVLQEQRGTCSTKHALIKSLADELNMEIMLKLGFYIMDANNTPSIEKVLEKHKIVAFPEAHCYLEHQGVKFDITFPNKISHLEDMKILHEENILPSQIGTYKVKKHKQFIKTWLDTTASAIPFEDIWFCREECIRALAGNISYSKSPTNIDAFTLTSVGSALEEWS